MDTAEFDEAAEVLSRLALIMGRPFAVSISVIRSGATLEFRDEDGDPIVDDDDFLVAATRDEVEDGTFLRMFAARALRAATVAGYQKLERMRTLKSKPEKAEG